MLPRSGSIVRVLLAMPLCACATGSMPLPDEVGVGADTGADTQGLPNPDPTFDSADDGGTDDRGSGDDGTSTGDAGQDTTDSGTTGGVAATHGTGDGTGDGSGDGSGSDSGDGGGGSESTGVPAGESTGATAVTLDVSSWTIVQANSTREFVFPAGTVLEAGTSIVIGRDASRPSFEDWWNTTLADDVIYFDSNDTFPAINGDETFTLRNAADAIVEGPTVAVALEGNVQRIDASLGGNQAAAWSISGNANAVATPGDGIPAPGDVPALVITEYSDANGNGAYPFEFVELTFLVP